MILNNKCLCCGSSANLNTKMQIKVDTKEYPIVLCDEHEDISPKKAREMVATKVKEYADLVEKLKGYGMNAEDCDMTAGGIAIPKSEPEPETQPIPAGQPSGVKVIMNKSRPAGQTVAVTEAPMLRSDNFEVKPMSGVAKGLSGEMSLEGRSSINVQSAIAGEVAAARKSGTLTESSTKPMSKISESQTLRGRGGAPMTIPRRIKHNIGGETLINVVDTGGDRTLQDRTRALAQEDGWRPGAFRYKSGYDVTECSLCQGMGNTSINNEPCPKCRGTGILNKGWAG